MAVSESCKQKLENGAMLFIYNCDIFEIGAKVIVCSHRGAITRVLTRVAGRDYEDSILKLRMNDDWKIYEASAGDLIHKKPGFQKVFQIVVPCWERRCVDWLLCLEKLYENILKKADKASYTSITVPLLGTGLAGGKIKDCATVAVKVICGYPKLKHLVHINLVVKSDASLSAIQDVLYRQFNNVPGSARRKKLKHGVSSTGGASAGGASAGGAPAGGASAGKKPYTSTLECSEDSMKNNGSQRKSYAAVTSYNTRNTISTGSSTENTGTNRGKTQPPKLTNIENAKRKAPGIAKNITPKESNFPALPREKQRNGVEKDVKPHHGNSSGVGGSATSNYLDTRSDLGSNGYSTNFDSFNKHQNDPKRGKFPKRQTSNDCENQEAQRRNSSDNENPGSSVDGIEYMDLNFAYFERLRLEQLQGDSESTSNERTQLDSNGVRRSEVSPDNSDSDENSDSDDKLSSKSISRCIKCKISIKGSCITHSCGHTSCVACAATDCSEDSCRADAEKIPEDIDAAHSSKMVPCDSNNEEVMCAICMDVVNNPKKLAKCDHVFCTKCIDDCFRLHKPVCPSCGTIYGAVTGNMPSGSMDIFKSTSTIEGYGRYGSYCITYSFPSGTQGRNHANPGIMYCATTRMAYLPANPEGQDVCKMLKVAFQRRLTFTIGRSTTTGRENMVTWNDIHHKTSMSGGPTRFGYPDPSYLSRVSEELACKGVTTDDIKDVSSNSENIYVRD